MSDLKAKFEKAVADSKNLPERPDNQTLLKLYALFKQASTGDVEGKRPGFTDMVGRAKWDAWNEMQGHVEGRGDEAVHRADRGSEGLRVRRHGRGAPFRLSGRISSPS